MLRENPSSTALASRSRTRGLVVSLLAAVLLLPSVALAQDAPREAGAPDGLEDIGDPGEDDDGAASKAPADEEAPPADAAEQPAAEGNTDSAASSEGAAQPENEANASQPATDAVQTEPQAGEGSAESAEADEDADPDPDALSALAAQQIQILQVIEGRLSVGDELTKAQLDALVRLAHEGDDPRVRALAAAVLPWLGPVVLEDILKASDDKSPMVRAQVLNSLGALARTMNDEQRARALALAEEALDDRSDEVACGASRLLVSLDSDAAIAMLEARADKANDVRFGCYRQYAGLPMRDIEVEEPVLPDPVLTTPSNADKTKPVGDQVNLMSGLGRGILVTTFTGAGVVAGGLVNGSFFPPRDTLTYTRTTTTHTREEPNVLFGAGGALAAGAALGATAFGLQYVLGWSDFAPAVTVLGTTVAGGAGGYGLGLALNLEEPYKGLAMIGGTLGGLAIGTPFVWVLKPDEKDLTFMASAAGAMTLSGAMLTFGIVPEGYPVLFDRVRRADFGTGVGLMSGTAGAFAALLASPLLDISHGRMLAASGAGLFAGATGLAAGYLIPIAFDNLGLPITRSRIASGLGLLAGWAAATTVFVLLPDSWARVFERVRATKATSAVAIEGGKLKLGTPVVWTRDVSSLNERRVAVGLDFLSGDF